MYKDSLSKLVLSAAEQRGFRVLLKGTSVMVMREEEALLFHFPHKGLSWPQKLNLEPHAEIENSHWKCFTSCKPRDGNVCFFILYMFALRFSYLYFITEKPNMLTVASSRSADAT